MPDSPFCRPCWSRGKTGQTYRLAGQPNFRCHDCKTVYHEGLFEPWEFEWRDKRPTWEAGMKAKNLGEEATKVFKEQLKRLDKV